VTVCRPQIARALEDGLVDVPRGATQSPIACSAAPRCLSAREIASVERLPIDRTVVF